MSKENQRPMAEGYDENREGFNVFVIGIFFTATLFPFFSVALGKIIWYEWPDVLSKILLTSVPIGIFLRGLRNLSLGIRKFLGPGKELRYSVFTASMIMIPMTILIWIGTGFPK